MICMHMFNCGLFSSVVMREQVEQRHIMACNHTIAWYSKSWANKRHALTTCPARGYGVLELWLEYQVLSQGWFTVHDNGTVQRSSLSMLWLLRSWHTVGFSAALSNRQIENTVSAPCRRDFGTRVRDTHSTTWFYICRLISVFFRSYLRH